MTLTLASSSAVENAPKVPVDGGREPDAINCSMWQLHINRRRGEWTPDGTFPTVRDAVRRIIELEHYSIKGLHLEIFVESEFGTDEEAFGHLEYTGRDALYVVKRRFQ